MQKSLPDYVRHHVNGIEDEFTLLGRQENSQKMKGYLIG